MRDAILSLFVMGALPAAFKKPFVGMMLFSAFAYARLQDLTFGFARHQRWSFLIAIVMIAGWLFSSRRSPLLRPDPRTYIMMAMIVLVGAGMLATGEFTKSDTAKLVEYTKIVGIAIFTTGLVRHRGHLRVMLWVIALSLGFYGVKSGLHGLMTGGSLEIRQGPGGMLKDRNDFALALNMGIPMLLYLGLSEKRTLFRRAALAMVPLTALTVVFTHSRGGFVAMVATGMVLIWRSKNRVAGFTVVGLMGVAALFLAPESYVDRLKTIQSYEEDASARGRLHAWGIALNMIQANPVMGVGFGHFEENYTRYDPEESKVITVHGTTGRVAHNSYLQIWAECGTITFVLYMLLIVLCFFDAWSVRMQAKRLYASSWIINYASLFEAAFVAFVIGSVFLNRATFDLLYHLVALCVCFGAIAREEMSRAGELVVAPEAGERGILQLSEPPGFGRRRTIPGRRTFRDTPLPPVVGTT